MDTARRIRRVLHHDFFECAIEGIKDKLFSPDYLADRKIWKIDSTKHLQRELWQGAKMPGTTDAYFFEAYLVP
jgi:hypothetical protein